jgi:Holliday junction resolvase RusA-like endonuclease
MTQTLADELLGLAHAGALATERLLPKTWAPLGKEIRFTILGEPVSKANGRKLATVGKKDGPKRTLFIKSAKARAYERDASMQIPAQWPLITGPVFVRATLWYASERPDLDESIVLDVIQGRIYVNDRQVREKWIKHGIDRANPRAEITVQPLVAQQEPLF